MDHRHKKKDLNPEESSDSPIIMKKIKMESNMLHEDDIMSQFQHDNSNLEVEPACFGLENTINGDDYSEEIVMQRMDIRQPLSMLRALLEQKLGIELLDYSFWLQDSQMLESHKNLVDQCVQGEGLVQINVQIKPAQQRINIVDVLKPAEEYIDLANNSSPTPSPEENKNVIRWMIDPQFKKDQERLKIPTDPNLWTQTHVKHWLQWSVRQFNLASLKLVDWNITGAQLCNMTLEEFQAKVPHDPKDVFWTHLELLKKCKLVTVMQKDPSSETDEPISSPPKNNVKSPKYQIVGTVRSSESQPNNLLNVSLNNFENSSITLATSNKTLNSGQIQLWQFLLELLTDKEHKSAIQWLGTEGEFKLSQPETVAQLWGQRKNKPSMNYEKLSRALRYYYDGDMISKVQGKRFVYKFVCDLKQLLGYSAAELSNLVDESRDYF